MRTNITAHTPVEVDSSGYVPYVSINREEDGRVSITVRAEGQCAAIYLSPSVWDAMRKEIQDK